MKTEEIIELLNGYQAKCFRRVGSEVLPADPVTLANNLLLIRGLLIQLVDKVAEAENAYRKAKASRYDSLIVDGIKASPAKDTVDMDYDIRKLQVEADRLRNYMKFTDGICTSIQSVLKTYSTSDKNQY